MKAARSSAFVTTCFLLLVACSAGARHTSDSKLGQKFFQHEAEFEALLTDVQADDKLTMIGPHKLGYAGRTLSVQDNLSDIERLGLSTERWATYQRRLQDLGLVLIAKANGGVEFRVDAGSFFNGDSYKGYEYDSDPAEHSKANLDDYRISESDRVRSGGYYASRPLKGHWCLYIYVNG